VTKAYSKFLSTQTYSQYINDILKPPTEFNYKCIDLFAGCGGLSLGFESTGILTTGYEMEKDYANTYSQNLVGNCICQKLDIEQNYPRADIIIGGPPCQPFSVGGKQLGLKDSRDGFPVFKEAIRKLNPDIWLFENVRGLLYRNKHYFSEILSSMRGLNYVVEYKLLNAVDYGIPQNRQRLIVVGHRGSFSFPKKHSDKITVGEALGDLAYSIPNNAKFLTPSMDLYVAKYEKASKCVNPRDLYLDRPARTLTCRNLAGATGDMHRLKLPDGRRRRISVQEAAKLQSFPDWFNFTGKENSQYYQIGNAVPPIFARELAKSVIQYLESEKRHDSDAISELNSLGQMELFPKIKEKSTI